MATFHQDEFYHIYNQGNNRQPIFNDGANCVYFISLIEKYVAPHCDIISWCLMPNHFHFLVKTNQHSVQEKLVGVLKLTNLSNGLRILQTAYTAAFNRQFNMSGSLFWQRSKAKLIDTSRNDEYLSACFHYIHQNPLKAGLVYKMEDWKYSSFNDYLNQSIFTLTQKDLGIKYLNLDESTFYKESYGFVNSHLINKIS